ncbi:MAG: TonB-dependent siderophore receptor [Leadbetterella sp.]
MTKYIRIVSLLIFNITIYTTISLAQTGTIKGKVVDSEGKPIEFASVFILDQKNYTTTHFDGSYILSNVSAGNKTLTVRYLGFQTKEIQVLVESKNTTVQNVELVQNSSHLNEVTITTYSTRQKAVEDLNRMPISQLANPQTINQIDNSIIKQQNNLNISQVLRNVPGIVNIGSSQQFDMLSRGFPVSNAVNGVLNLSAFPEIPTSTYNVESAQVIKGPTGTIYGVGSPSGLVNIVTKKPLDEQKIELDASLGSFGQYRTVADLTGPFKKNGKLKYRFIVGNTNTPTFAKAFGNANDVFIAPQLQYDFSDKTSLAVEHNFSKINTNLFGGSEFILSAPTVPEEQQFDKEDKFIPTTRDFKFLDWNDFNFDTPKGVNSTNSNLYQVRFRHKLSDNWDIKLLSSTSNYSIKTNQLFYNGLTLIDETLLPAVSKENMQFIIEQSFFKSKNNAFQFSPYITGKFNTSNLKHALVIGGDYTFKNNDFEFSYLPGTFDLAPIQLSNPVFPELNFNDYTPDKNEYWDVRTQKIQSGGIYVQDVVKWKQFTFLAGARFEIFNEDLKSDLYDLGEYKPTNSSNTETSISPKIGLTYQPTQNTSVYASFTDGFVPNIDPGPGSGGPFSPERFNQIEIGARKEWFGGRLLSSIAVFNILRNNMLIADPTDELARRYIQIDEVKSKGIEVSTVGKINRSLTLNLGYAYNPTYAPGSLNIHETDGDFPLAPKNTVNAWLNYELQTTGLKGLSVGFGGNHVGSSSSYISTLRSPSFSTVDGSLGYKISRFTVQLNVDNLLNNNYTKSIWDERGSLRGTPRVVRFNVHATF